MRGGRRRLLLSPPGRPVALASPPLPPPRMIAECLSLKCTAYYFIFTAFNTAVIVYGTCVFMGAGDLFTWPDLHAGVKVERSSFVYGCQLRQLTGGPHTGVKNRLSSLSNSGGSASTPGPIRRKREKEKVQSAVNGRVETAWKRRATQPQTRARTHTHTHTPALISTQ